jgi:putative oxidoreductase
MFASIRALYDRAVHLLRKIEWTGPLLVRLTLGLVFVTSGWGKLHSLDDVTKFFESLNIPAPGIQARFVSSIEFGGGLLLIAGFGTRIVSALLIGVMTVAILTAKLPDLHGVVDLAGTDEFAYLVMFVWLVVSGGGAASVDRLLARRGGTESRVGVAP